MRRHRVFWTALLMHSEFTPRSRAACSPGRLSARFSTNAGVYMYLGDSISVGFRPCANPFFLRRKRYAVALLVCRDSHVA